MIIHIIYYNSKPNLQNEYYWTLPTELNKIFTQLM